MNLKKYGMSRHSWYNDLYETILWETEGAILDVNNLKQYSKLETRNYVERGCSDFRYTSIQTDVIVFVPIHSESHEQQYTDYSLSSLHHRTDMFLPKSNSSSHLDEERLSNCFLLSNMAAIKENQLLSGEKNQIYEWSVISTFNSVFFQPCHTQLDFCFLISHTASNFPQSAKCYLSLLRNRNKLNWT